jgi:hypothetical protein
MSFMIFQDGLDLVRASQAVDLGGRVPEPTRPRVLRLDGGVFEVIEAPATPADLPPLAAPPGLAMGGPELPPDFDCERWDGLS